MLIAGKYTIGKLIDKGAFGEIYEGTCKQTGTRIAIKLVRFR